MAKKTIKRRPWLKSEIAMLKKFVKAKTPIKTIAKTLGRTMAAIQQKASKESISFRR